MVFDQMFVKQNSFLIKSETLISQAFLLYGQLLFIIFINLFTLQRGYPSFC